MGYNTIEELKDSYGGEYKILYLIGEADVQALARREFQVSLSEEELNRVAKGIEWGLLDWTTVVKTAIEEVLKNKIDGG